MSKKKYILKQCSFNFELKYLGWWWGKDLSRDTLTISCLVLCLKIEI